MRERFLRYSKLILLTLLMAGCQQHVFKQGTPGKCVGVKDGDTIVVLIDGKQVTIRLAEVDCPEKRQAYGQRAKQFTSDLCFGKDVSVVEKNKDRYGRTIGIVYVDDTTILNKELVRAGMAWRYAQYSEDDSYGELEDEARAAHRGLWADENPEAPWEFRKHGRAPSRPSHRRKYQPEEESTEVES
ncbi:MAG: thermonuclease family protein [Bacteroidetes bacterium]|nr:thermonuclease family protein [Bacteroidota bacterium]